MYISDDFKAKWENTLKEKELMNPQDQIVEYTKGDYWEFGQIRGQYFFTNQSIIFYGGLGGVSSFAINYTDIEGIKPCMVNLFIPTGLAVFAMDRAKGKVRRYKLSVMKRKQWMAFIAQNAGIAL